MQLNIYDFHLQALLWAMLDVEEEERRWETEEEEEKKKK